MKKLSFFLNFLIISLCLIIGGAFFYLKFVPKPEIVAKTSALTQEQMDELVNQHLQKTLRENRLTKAANNKAISELEDNLAEQKRLMRIKQDKENAQIPLERQIWKEEKIASRPSPSEEYSRIANENIEQNKADEEEKKEYAREWIQNARKNGYLLELSPDLEVIKYVPIRKPSQQDDAVESAPSD